MKKHGIILTFSVLFLSFFLSACMSQNGRDLLYVALVPEKSVSITVKSGSVGISGYKNYNPNSDDVFNTGVTTRDQIQTNRIGDVKLSEGKTSVYELKYGYEIILNVQNMTADGKPAEIEVVDQSGNKKSYVLEAPLNFKTLSFGYDFRM